MRALLITYELKAKGWDYAPFVKALKTAPNWWHYLSSTWLVITDKTPKEFHSVLGEHLSTEDSLLIVEITGSYWGFLVKDAWDWIDKYVPRAKPE